MATTTTKQRAANRVKAATRRATRGTAIEPMTTPAILKTTYGRKALKDGPTRPSLRQYRYSDGRREYCFEIHTEAGWRHCYRGCFDTWEAEVIANLYTNQHKGASIILYYVMQDQETGELSLRSIKTK